MYTLSIILPSNRPEGLDDFILSLGQYDTEKVQIVILKDDDKEYVEFMGNVIVIHKIPEKPLSVGKLQEACFRVSTGKWIFFANDDIVCETPDWDKILLAEFLKIPDDIALFWPDDKMFGERLSCFPIISRKILEMINFFPTPYWRYKIDDTIFDIMPFDRKFYMPNIVFRHKNDQGEEGYKLNSKQVYPVDRVAANHDHEIWDSPEQKNWRVLARTFVQSVTIPDMNTKILIGVPTGKIPQFGEFDDYLAFLQKPANTFVSKSRSQSPARNRNLLIEQAIGANCTHILFLDDDMAFNSDLLLRLLKHDKDVVSGIYFLRNFPHPPAIFDHVNEIGHCRYHFLSKEEKGLIPIVAAGFGAVLIKVEVLKKMEKPWVRLGEMNPDMWCDDIGFFNRLRDITTDMWCDLDAKVGHMSNMTIWPNVIEDAWYTTYSTYGAGSVSTPQINPILEKEKAEKLQLELDADKERAQA